MDLAALTPIRTERLVLRRYTAEDLASLSELQRDPDVTRFLLYDAQSPEQARKNLAKRTAPVAFDAAHPEFTLAVTLAGSGAYLGEVSLFLLNEEQRTGEVGYVFLPGAHGRGYATEATREMLRAGFSTAGMHRIVARLDARNEASANVLKRLGMRQEAHFVRNEFLKGEWTDELVFAMLADDWLG